MSVFLKTMHPKLWPYKSNGTLSLVDVVICTFHISAIKKLQSLIFDFGHRFAKCNYRVPKSEN
jgi:hypothetical protein